MATAPPSARRADRDVLRATVERALSTRSFDLRARDGRLYRVSLPFSVGLQSGLSVRVSGDLRGSTFEARLVSIGDFNASDDDSYDNGSYNNGDYNNGNAGYGRSVILTGRVTRIFSVTDFEVRDDDDGTIYRVTTRTPLPYSVRVGDRVQARGDLNGREIRADSASAIGAANGDGAGKAVDFPATLQSVLLNLGEATVRADNGYSYRIKADRNLLDDFRIGQRVRCAGSIATASLKPIRWCGLSDYSLRINPRASTDFQPRVCNPTLLVYELTVGCPLGGFYPEPD